MSQEQTYLGNFDDIHSLSQLNNNYIDLYGGNFNSFFKPFATFPNSTGIPHYDISLYNTNVVPSAYSFVGADSSGLNPFGVNTLSEGIVYGSNPNSDLEVGIDPNTVRTFGIKTPITFVGWGFDTFGYPAPNYSSGWTENSYLGSASPSGTFLSPTGSSISHGRGVPIGLWKSGPLDLRWDSVRKVWTPPASVFSAHIIAAYSGTSLISDFTQGITQSSLRYDAIIYDGIANKIRVTGITPSGPRNDNYKVIPLSSGQFCQIVHDRVGNRPGYSICLNENLATTSCNTSTNLSNVGASAALSLADDYLTYGGLTVVPLEEQYGGTGESTYSSGQILIGDPSGGINASLVKRTLIAGTGLRILHSANSLTFAFATGVSFTAAGINSTINELTGLTTPLSIAQGGTGASGQIFVDISTSQSVGGTKTFTSGVRVVSGTLQLPGLSFANDIRTGFTYHSANGIYTVSSGNVVSFINSTGVFYYVPQVIAPIYPNYSNNTPSLTIRQGSSHSGNNPILVCQLIDSTNLFSVDSMAITNTRYLSVSGASSGITTLVSIIRPSGFSNNVKTISASGHLIGEYFSVSSSGSNMTLGSSGNRLTLVAPTGNTTLITPTGGGVIATTNQINYIPIVDVFNTYSILGNEDFILCSGSNYGIHLPFASGIRGRRFIIKQSSTGFVNIIPTGSNLIDRQVSYRLYGYNSVSVLSDGNNWWTFGQSPTGLAMYG